jgi:Gram-negative bacterial TonB protein C-terminal
MKKNLLIICCFILSLSTIAQSGIKSKSYSYETVEIKPQFPGSITEFMKYVMKNYQVPEDDEGSIATGTVLVSIEIDVQGNVNNINIIKDVGNAGKEIKRVLSKCPKWTPGRQNFENVVVVYEFPIKIQ